MMKGPDASARSTAGRGSSSSDSSATVPSGPPPATITCSSEGSRAFRRSMVSAMAKSPIASSQTIATASPNASARSHSDSRNVRCMPVITAPMRAERDVNGHPTGSVAQLDADHVAHPDTEAPEPGGEAVAQRTELGERHAPFRHDDRGGVRRFRDGPVEPVGQELVAPQPLGAVARGETRIVGHGPGQPRAGFAPVVPRSSFHCRACPRHRARD